VRSSLGIGLILAFSALPLRADVVGVANFTRLIRTSTAEVSPIRA